MDDSQSRQLNLQIACDGATDEELASPTRQLLSLLRGTELESAELLPGGPAPSGSKGDPVTIGSFAVQAWIAGGPGRTVKSKDFKFEGSPKQAQELLKMYGRGNTRK